MSTRLPLLLLLLAGCVAPGGPEDPSPPPTPPPAPVLRFSEVMYHPLLEQGFSDAHEFVELVNAGEGVVDLRGWRLEGGVEFTFDEGPLAPGDAVLVVEDLDAFFVAYPVPVEQVAGSWAGGLSNRGERLALVAPDGAVMDELTYSDSFPWPLGPDALGADARWIQPPPPPLVSHRFRGRSLQRISLAAPTDDPGTWVASELGGADPGVVNAAEPGPRPVVVALSLRDPVGQPLRPDTPLRIALRLNGAPVQGLRLEWWADDLGSTGEPVESVPLDEEGDERVATLPSQPDGTILRLRVAADGDGGLAVLSPRPGDPAPWHVAFVGVPPPGQTPAYQLFIAPDDWTSLWDGTADNRVVGCEPNPTWNDQVPAVFVDADGAAFDVFTRYQGSRWNRRNGQALSAWTAPGPARPAPVRALSWRVAFPAYAPLDGDKGTVALNKLSQSCPGLSTAVGFALFAEAGLPVPRVRYRRLFINGGYYHYTQEIEGPDEGMMERYHDAQAASGSSAPLEPGAGHLFKAAGCNCDEGPFGWADGRVLEPHCGYSKEERYAATYDRKTHGWAGPEELRALIEGHADVRATGDEEALRDWLAAHFALDEVLSYLAVINWAVPFDDIFQNHYLYQRRSDGRWLFAPWDLDLDFGGWKGADASIYIGAQGDPDNRAGWWNLFKDSFLVAYRPEFEARLRALNGTVLAPPAVEALVLGVRAQWSLAEAQAAPAGLACDWEAGADAFVRFAQERYAVVNEALPTP